MPAAYEVGQTPRIVAGSGALERLQAWISTVGEPVLLVGDRGIEASGLLAQAREAIGAAVAVELFVAPAGEPTTVTVDAAADAARALGAAAVVGIGGGTALDLAKLTAALATTDRPIADFVLGADGFAGRVAAAMIPTTSGTGAEVTRTCIVSDAEGRKLWVWDPAVMPDLVILDPTLTVSLPPHLTVATGLDAFVHALEAATGGNRNPLNEGYALQAIRLIDGALSAVVAEPSDLDARLAMQEGAMLAGLAIDSGGTGVAHNIGHAMGSLYHIPHGIAVAVGLQASLSWSLNPDPARYASAAFALGLLEDSRALAPRFDRWLEELGFAVGVQAAGYRLIEAERLAHAMMAPENAPMAANNARVPQPQDIDVLAERTAALWNGLAA